MKIVGIIAEYNPFHKGHAYHIQEAKKASGADFAIVAMSGNFVQRGGPAIIDKYTRTKMALLGGADVVLELPVPFATAAAPIFAKAGVELFNHLGCVDALCFGSESGDINSLCFAARTLAEEPPIYKGLLQTFLKEGNSYPKSVQMAMQAYAESKAVHENTTSIFSENDNAHSTSAGLIASPNDTLAIEYLKALLGSGSSIVPIAVKREGNGYHETTLSSDFASASAIRKKLEELPSEGKNMDATLSSLAQFLPSTSLSLMEAALRHTFPVTEDDFSLALGMILQSGQMANGMPTHQAADMTAELVDRIKHLYSSGSLFTFSELAEQLKTKNITRARINRALLHCLLSISQDDLTLFQASGCCSYARILGFQKNAAPLLKSMKKNANIPILTKLADAKNKLDQTGSNILSVELASSFLYRQAVWCKFHKLLPDEYRAGVIII